MDTELLVDGQIADGQLLVEQLVKDNFEVSAAFWVKLNDDSLWQLYIASPEVDEHKSTNAYRKVYSSLSNLSLASISNLDINVISDNNPTARAVIELRDRLPARIPTRHRGRRLGSLPVKEVYIYQKMEQPLRQSFLVTYVKQGDENEWRATTQMKEFVRGRKETGAITYSTALGLTPASEGPKFALIHVLAEVAPGLDESIVQNRAMMVQLAEQSRFIADKLFKEKHPQAIITHEPLMLPFPVTAQTSSSTGS
jgi:hypothetical protein